MKRSYIYLLIISMIWGTSFLFIHNLNESIGPGGVVFFRSLLGLVVITGFVIFSKGIKWLELPWGKFLFVGVFNNLLPWLFIAYGQLSVPSGVASIINALTPISTVLVGVFFQQRLRVNQWIGVMIGYLGILFLVNVSFLDVKNASMMPIFFIGAATIFYGTSTQFVRKYLTDVEPKIIAFGAMIWATPMAFIVMMETFPGGAKELLNVNNAIAILILGCLGSGIAQILYYDLVKKEGPVFASATTYIVPIMAIVWGALLLGEKIKINMLLGLFFVLAGVALMSLKNLKLFRKEKEPV